MDMIFNFDMDMLLNVHIWASLLTLTLLEIVLGIDNIIFLSIVSGRLPPEQRALARKVGLSLAMLMRIALLCMIAWIAKLTTPLFTILDYDISWRDIILIGGGLFLLVKGTLEVHKMAEGHDEHGETGKARAVFAAVIAQIIVLDMVFSLDSVITAVGMAEELWVMVAAVIIAILVMMVAAESISNFVNAHPTVKMLALSFLLLVGVALIADGLHFHIPRGYLYFAIAFSLTVEVLNLMASKSRSRKLAALEAAERAVKTVVPQKTKKPAAAKKASSRKARPAAKATPKVASKAAPKAAAPKDSPAKASARPAKATPTKTTKKRKSSKN